MDLRRWISGCVGGSEADWAGFVREVTPWIRTVLARAARRFGMDASPSGVDDLLNAFFAKLLDRDRKLLRDYKPEYPPEVWFRVIAVSLVRDRYRREVRGREALAAMGRELEEPTGGSPPDRISLLERGLDSLPVVDRLLLQLRFWKGLSYAEISRSLGIPESSVGPRLAEGKRALADLLLRLERSEEA